MAYVFCTILGRTKNVNIRNIRIQSHWQSETPNFWQFDCNEMVRLIFKAWDEFKSVFLIRLVQSWTRYKKAQPFNIWNNRKDSSIFRQLVAPSNFKRFNMKVSFGTLQKKTTTVGNFCNMFFCNTLLIKTFALYRPSIGKEWNGSKYKSKLRSGKIHTLTYIMYNIGATFF